jgi:hypothetical protein
MFIDDRSSFGARSARDQRAEAQHAKGEGRK